MKISKLIKYLYLLPFILYVTPYNDIGLYIIIPLLFIYFIFKQSAYSLKSTPFILYALLTLWTFLMIPFAYNEDIALNIQKTYLGTIIFCYVTYEFSYRGNFKIALLSFLLIWACLTIFSFFHQSSFLLEDVSKERLGSDDHINSNDLAYLSFYATSCSYIFYRISKGIYKFLSKILILCCFIMSFVLALYTASRQLLLIQIPLFACLSLIDFKIKRRNVILLIISIILIIFLIIPIYSYYYDGSYLQLRSDTNLKEDVRYMLIKNSFEVGLNHFFTGVGPGNYSLFSPTHNFSHNTFLELFANVGILGPILYIAMLISYLKAQIKYYNKSHNRIFVVFLIIGIFFLIDNFFYVFYGTPFLMAFFFMLDASSKSLFLKHAK